MLYSAPTLRSAALSCRMQPTLLTNSSFHTASPTPLRASDSSSPNPRRVPVTKRQVTFKKASMRNASSISTPSPSSTGQAGSATPQTPRLDWNTFFKLRKSRRRYQLGSSIASGIAGFGGGAEFLVRSDMDKLVANFPLDPFITLGIITFLCGGLGWLGGPIIGTAAFNYRNRAVKDDMAAKEKEFYKRIKKYRVDPSASSAANPVPDYYGEKIGSISGYRQWLKDQRAFNRKRKNYF